MNQATEPFGRPAQSADLKAISGKIEIRVQGKERDENIVCLFSLTPLLGIYALNHFWFADFLHFSRKFPFYT